MTWKLYLDDKIHDPDASERHAPEGFIGAASTAEAIVLVESLGVPEYMSLDHDLGIDDRSIDFLKWLSSRFIYPPSYTVHSSNPIGRDNIISFMECWKKVQKSGKKWLIVAEMNLVAVYLVQVLEIVIGIIVNNINMII